MGGWEKESDSSIGFVWGGGEKERKRGRESGGGDVDDRKFAVGALQFSNIYGIFFSTLLYFSYKNILFSILYPIILAGKFFRRQQSPESPSSCKSDDEFPGLVQTQRRENNIRISYSIFYFNRSGHKTLLKIKSSFTIYF